MKALIPAAGLGSRWYPWSKVIPKELLPLANYPAIHYVLEEVVAAGILEIGIIVSTAKKLVKIYVDKIWKLAHPEVNVTWLYQSSPRGVGHALLCARNWVQDEPTAVLYPDELHPQNGGINQLYRAFNKFPGCCIGITVNKQNRRQAIYKILKTEANLFKINGFAHENHSREIGYGTGRYILGSGLVYLTNPFCKNEQNTKKHLDDNIVFEPLFDKEILGIALKEPIFDIGNPENYSLATSMITIHDSFHVEHKNNMHIRKLE
jgi:UTP--glucose-1-phosphate uridylyltransferase